MQVRNLLLYQVSDKKVNVSVYFEKGTFWLTQKAIAALFGVNRTVVTKHLKNIFETDELAEDSVCANFAHTAEDGKNYETKFLELSNYPILKDKGRVSMLEAKLKAESEFEKFRVIQDQNYESDFDREIKKLIP